MASMPLYHNDSNDLEIIIQQCSVHCCFVRIFCEVVRSAEPSVPVYREDQDHRGDVHGSFRSDGSDELPRQQARGRHHGVCLGHPKTAE